jgi:hypothetical protein
VLERKGKDREGLRLMRFGRARCKDRNGAFTVETTAWEGSGGVRG